MNRREFLLQSAHTAASVAWFSLFGPHTLAKASPRPWHSQQAVFTLGVASGEPRPNSVVLWTRLAPAPLEAQGGMPDQAITVRWELAHDEQFSRIAQQGEMVTDAQRAHTVHVDVRGLASDRHYFYRFIAGRQSSPIGRTRTAPDITSKPERLRIALASCQHFEMGYFGVHREIAEQDVDLVLFVGDYLYQYNVKPYMRVRHHALELSDTPSLLDLRIHHASYKLDPNLRAAHAAHPWLLMWDDQEVRNDYDGLNDPGEVPNAATFLQVRQRAYRAYYEHLPISPTRAPSGIGAPMFSDYAWGQLAKLWLIDTRQYRSAPPCTDIIHGPQQGRVLWRCDKLYEPTQTMLGTSQEQWLSNSLAQSPHTWQLLAQTTQIAPAPLPTALGPVLYGDGWDAYPGARERLMQAIAQAGANNVICLGGDVHRHVAAKLRQKPGDRSSPVVASEFVGTSITSKGLSELLTDALAAGNPDVLHCRSDERGYALLDITPQQLQCTFRATPHPAQAHANLHTQARYVVATGAAGPQKD